MGNLASNIGSAIDDIFSPLWDFITNILDWLNPFSDNFIGKYIVSAIGDILQFLFVPKDNFFEDSVESIKSNLSSKIPFGDYISLFETLKTVTAGEDLSIDLNNYQVGDLNISQNKFINFEGVTKYRDIWFGWCRGFTYIFMVIYNVNQIIKLLRGFSATDGANLLKGGSKN